MILCDNEITRTVVEQDKRLKYRSFLVTINYYKLNISDDGVKKKTTYIAKSREISNNVIRVKIVMKFMATLRIVCVRIILWKRAVAEMFEFRRDLTD